MGYKTETWGGNKYKVPTDQKTTPVYSGSSSGSHTVGNTSPSAKKTTPKKSSGSKKTTTAVKTTASAKSSGGGYRGGYGGGGGAEEEYDAKSAYEEYLKKLQKLAKKIYNQNMNSINESYTNAGNTLKTNYDSTTGQLKNQFDYQTGTVNTDAENSMREAYINSMLQKKDLGQKMSAQGLNGGMTETTMSRLANNYSNARNNIDTTRQKSLSDLNQTYNSNVAEAQRQYNSAVSNLAMQRAEAERAARDAYLNLAIQYQFNPGSISMPTTNYSAPLKAQSSYTYTPTAATNNVKGVTTTQGGEAAIAEAQNNYARYLAKQKASGASDSSLKNSAYQALTDGQITGDELVDILNQLNIAV